MRDLFRRYLEAGSVVRLKQLIDAEDLRLPVRVDGAGRSTGGGLLSRGHIYKILSNPIYIGRIAHKGHVHEGQHSRIVEPDLWDRVQQRLQDHVATAKTRRVTQSSDSLLAGKLFDDRGNRMSSSWARKGPKRWRYYLSQALLQGEKAKAGSIARIPAAEIERRVVEALRKIELRLGSGARSVDDDQAEKSPPSTDRGELTCDRRAEIRALNLYRRSLTTHYWRLATAEARGNLDLTCEIQADRQERQDARRRAEAAARRRQEEAYLSSKNGG